MKEDTVFDEHMIVAIGDSARVRRYGICTVRELYEDQRQALVITPGGREVTVSLDEFQDFSF